MNEENISKTGGTFPLDTWSYRTDECDCNDVKHVVLGDTDKGDL